RLSVRVTAHVVGAVAIAHSTRIRSGRRKTGATRTCGSLRPTAGTTRKRGRPRVVASGASTAARVGSSSLPLSLRTSAISGRSVALSSIGSDRVTLRLPAGRWVVAFAAPPDVVAVLTSTEAPFRQTPEAYSRKGISTTTSTVVPLSVARARSGSPTSHRD